MLLLLNLQIYESCFGPEVVKQIRKEMKVACLKCASYEPPMYPTEEAEPSAPPQRPTGNTNKLDGVAMDAQNTLFANAQTFDVEKLNQAILAYRPVRINFNHNRVYVLNENGLF